MFLLKDERGYDFRESTVRKALQEDHPVFRDNEPSSSQQSDEQKESASSHQLVQSPEFLPTAIQRSIKKEVRQEESETNEIFQSFAKLAGVQNLKISRKAFDDLDPRHQAEHTNQAKKIIDEVVRRLCPSAPQQLWKAIIDQEIGQRCSNADNEKEKLTQSIAKAYLDANQPSDKQQLLSLLADSMSFSDCKQHIPDLKSSTYYRARAYAKEFGAGTKAAEDRETYIRYDAVAVEHFINYVLSYNVVSDLPFGEQTLKLTSGEQLTVPNVIRDAIPERIIRQYREFCKQEIQMESLPVNFPQLQRTSLLDILDACKASKRKALQGNHIRK